jgi:hypothetical protein
VALNVDERNSTIRRERAVAFNRIVHLVVDLYERLHAGGAADRDGNVVELRYEEARTSLPVGIPRAGAPMSARGSMREAA